MSNPRVSMEKLEKTNDVLNDLMLEPMDAQQRALIQILGNINQAIIDNTEQSKSIGSRLDAHLVKFDLHLKAYDEHRTDEAILYGKGQVAWKIATWLLGVLQAAVLFVWMDVRNDLRGIHEDIGKTHVFQAEIVTRVDTIEKQHQIEQGNKK